MIVEICALVRCYTTCSCNFSPTFRDNLWVPSWPLNMEPIGCLETSPRHCHYMLRDIPEEHRSHLLRGRSMKSTISTISIKKKNIPCASECIFENFRYGVYNFVLDSSWNVMVHGDAREGNWWGNWRMEWVASTLHTTSEHGVSSITTADAHTSAASSRLNWRPRRFKWTRPFRRKTKSVFCACAIRFQLASASVVLSRFEDLIPKYN